LRGLFQQNQVLKWLLIVNVGIWIMVKTSQLVLNLSSVGDTNLLVTWLSLPADWSAFIRRPWTAITYMFLQVRFWQLFFNVWMLWFGGTIFVRSLSQKQFAWTYGLGGLAGAAFFLAAYYVFPGFEAARKESILLGAAAPVMAVLVAAAAYAPDYELRLFLFGRLKFKWVALAFVGIDLLSMMETPDYLIAHLGGAVFGLIYGIVLRMLAKKGTKRPKKQRKPKVEYTPYEEIHDEPEVPRSDEEYKRKKAETERDIDAILDKIAQSGYGSLTAEEKEFLFKNSR
jgi:membrane associated rhomboid family serine protease